MRFHVADDAETVMRSVCNDNEWKHLEEPYLYQFSYSTPQL